MTILKDSSKLEASNDNEPLQDRDSNKNAWLTLATAFAFIIGIGCFLFLIGFWVEY